MAKKKTDPYDEAKEQGTTLEAFIMPQKVEAFKDAYQPCAENLATEIFDETRLRNFFKAWLTSLGDPLVLYLRDLEDAGFKLRVGRIGEPAIFVTERNFSSSVTTDLLEAPSEDSEQPRRIIGLDPLAGVDFS